MRFFWDFLDFFGFWVFKIFLDFLDFFYFNFFLVSFKVTKVTTKCYLGYYGTPKIAQNGPKQHKKLFFCPKGQGKISKTKNKKKLRDNFRPLPNKNVQMLDHFFPLLFPKDSESLKILDIRLREVGAKRPLNGASKVKKVREKKLFFARRFSTIFKQKCSYLRQLLSITFPQGFQISKNIGHPTSGSGGKKTVKRYLKSEQTHRQTNRRTDRRTFRLIESSDPEGRCFDKLFLPIILLKDFFSHILYQNMSSVNVLLIKKKCKKKLSEKKHISLKGSD